MPKLELTDKHFIDWESETFGYGYGTGEAYILQVLQEFLARCPNEGTYNFEVLENNLGATVAWLLINTLCKADIIEYGCSPRFGWLDIKGILLKNYIENKDLDTLYNLTMLDYEGDGFVSCSKGYCNCEKGQECNNPMFKSSSELRAL